LVLVSGVLTPLYARAQSTTTTYEFTGACSDCTGVGIGYLTLQNYTPGTALSYTDFVSFTYQSSLSVFSISASGMSYDVSTAEIPIFDSSTPSVLTVGLSGALGASAGPYDVLFQADSVNGDLTNQLNFQSCLMACPAGDSSGAWQLSATISVAEGSGSEFPGGKSGQINDFGTAHTWAVAAPEIDAASAAAALTLLIGNLALLGGRRSLRPTMGGSVG
jgi:hypothetical protein